MGTHAGRDGLLRDIPNMSETPTGVIELTGFRLRRRAKTFLTQTLSTQCVYVGSLTVAVSD